MAKVTEGKIRLLIVLKTLTEKSDYHNRFSAQALISAVEDAGYKAERKAIYDDIAAIKEMGYDVIFTKERPAGWYIGQRTFELPELKLLIDAVQSSKFITKKKSTEMIKKIGSLAGEGDAKALRRQVHVAGRVKTDNERIFYNVDAIQEALRENRKIRFRYFVWDINKKKVAKHDGKAIEISPWALTWEEENNYMLGFEALAGIIKHYRVDKMENIQVSCDKREGSREFGQIDMSAFAKRTFGMFGGKTETVMLECENNLIGAILDRFGTDVIIVKSDEEHFCVQNEVTVSGQFFGWLVGLGPGVRIKAPKTVAEEFRKRLKAMTE